VHWHDRWRSGNDPWQGLTSLMWGEDPLVTA